jgi:hypothetical protein
MKLNYTIPNEVVLIEPESSFNWKKPFKVTYGGKEILVWGLLLIKCEQNKEIIKDSLSKK